MEEDLKIWEKMEDDLQNKWKPNQKKNGWRPQNKFEDNLKKKSKTT